MLDFSVFVEPPERFSPHVEVAACYCEWNGTLLFLKRHSSKPQGETWGVPGGKLEKGEKPREAIIREVREEVGLDVSQNQLQHLGQLYIRLPHVDYIFHMFYFPFAILPIVNLALEEHSEYKWISPGDALYLPLIVGGEEALAHFQRLRGQSGKP